MKHNILNLLKTNGIGLKRGSMLSKLLIEFIIIETIMETVLNCEKLGT